MNARKEQAGGACKQTPGKTSQTGTNVLDRTILNTPQNENIIRGSSLRYIRSVFGDEFVDKAIKDGIVVVI